ncbi:citrate-binding protein-like [Forsythia ovata]|uniref:Citrate-binding protein-like n=1 Tax=Forsythia ovata TaxID=205694 RepID=A0ABD1PVG6_9LAMI
MDNFIQNWLPRRVMSAWRLVGIVHALEGWNVHECRGTLFDVDKIWQASLKHGFLPLVSDGHDYSSGVWQFDGYGFVPNRISSATIVQIHGAVQESSTIILRIYNGDLMYYSGQVIASGMYDKWFRVNLIHDVVEGKVIIVSIDRRIM